MECDWLLEWLDRAIAQGIADADAGLTQDIDEVRAEIAKHFAT
jgi:predicted transcriptional regulator